MPGCDRDSDGEATTAYQAIATDENNRYSLGISVFALLIACEYVAAQSQWSQFRGPGARGIAKGTHAPDRWSTTENIAWKRDLPGRGWSSPVVWNEHVFLTTVVNTGTSEEAKKGLYFGGIDLRP